MHAVDVPDPGDPGSLHPCASTGPADVLFGGRSAMRARETPRSLVC